MGTRLSRLTEVVLMSTHNLCFEQKYEKYQSFLSENFLFLAVKFSIHLNRRVFVMQGGTVSSCGQQRFWLDCTDAQADLSLRWAHVRRYVFSLVKCYGEWIHQILFRKITELVTICNTYYSPLLRLLHFLCIFYCPKIVFYNFIPPIKTSVTCHKYTCSFS